MSSPRAGVFNLETAEDLFYCITQSLRCYKEAKAKEIDRLFFVVMGLTHLREWIAPEPRSL